MVHCLKFLRKIDHYHTPRSVSTSYKRSLSIYHQPRYITYFTLNCKYIHFSLIIINTFLFLIFHSTLISNTYHVISECAIGFPFSVVTHPECSYAWHGLTLNVEYRSEFLCRFYNFYLYNQSAYSRQVLSYSYTTSLCT